MAAAWKAPWIAFVATLFAPSAHGLVLQHNASKAAKADYSLKFPGSTTSSYAISPGYSFPSGTAGDFSVEGWIKITHAGRYWFSYASSGNNNCLLASSNVGTYGTWVHWAMNVASNMAITHYINGAVNGGPMYSGSYCGQPGTLVLAQDQDCVGGCLDAGQAPEMWIDSLRVYAGTLTSTEISSLASGSTCVAKAAWSNWAMSDSASIGTDYGSGAQDLTLVGSVTTETGVTSCGGGGASAVGDPHLQNVHGERFDLMKPGKHVLINIPRGERADKALLRVQADAQRLGGQCTDMYFQEVNVTGSWAGAKVQKTGGLRYHAQEAGERARWMRFGPVQLKVAHGHTREGIKYLNLYVKSLSRTGFAVGGLLGEDDHSEEETPPKDCHHRIAL